MDVLSGLLAALKLIDDIKLETVQIGQCQPPKIAENPAEFGK